jgi:hypothetical protein
MMTGSNKEGTLDLQPTGRCAIQYPGQLERVATVAGDLRG